MITIIPALLESDVEAVADKVAEVASDGYCQTVQVDIVDGQLAPQLTVTPYDLADLTWGEIRLDFHLMTEDPLDYVWELAAQHLPVRLVAGQIERMSDQMAFLTAVRERGWQTALALDVDTPLDSIDDHVWPMLDELLLLAVPLGQQGQPFSPEVIPKIHAAHRLISERRLTTKIAVDGGIKTPEAVSLRDLGVAELVVGSFLWRGDFSERRQELELALSDG